MLQYIDSEKLYNKEDSRGDAWIPLWRGDRKDLAHELGMRTEGIWLKGESTGRDDWNQNWEHHWKELET